MPVLDPDALDGTHTKEATIYPPIAVVETLLPFAAVVQRPEFGALVLYLAQHKVPGVDLRPIADGLRAVLGWRDFAAARGPAAVTALEVASYAELAEATRRLPVAWELSSVTEVDIARARCALALYYQATQTDGGAPEATKLARAILSASPAIAPDPTNALALHAVALLARSGLTWAPVPEPCPDPSACDCALCSGTHADHATDHAAPPAPDPWMAALNGVLPSCPTGTCPVR